MYSKKIKQREGDENFAAIKKLYMDEFRSLELKNES